MIQGANETGYGSCCVGFSVGVFMWFPGRCTPDSRSSSLRTCLIWYWEVRYDRRSTTCRIQVSVACSRPGVNALMLRCRKRAVFHATAERAAVIEGDVLPPAVPWKWRPRHMHTSSSKFPPSISEANEIAGSQTGSQRRQMPRDTGRRQATISPGNWPFKRRQATSRDAAVAPYKRGAGGSNPPAPTRQNNLVMIMLIRQWVTNWATTALNRL